MKRFVSAIFSAALVFGLLAAAPANAHDDHSPGDKKVFTKHFQQTLFDITRNAAFSVEVLLDDKEYKIGQGVIGIVIHDAKDSDVIGANITVTLKNIGTGAFASGPVSIADKGNGLYIVSGLNLQREGRWEFSVAVRKGDTEDSAQFILPDALEKFLPKGRYLP